MKKKIISNQVTAPLTTNWPTLFNSIVALMFCLGMIGTADSQVTATQQQYIDSLFGKWKDPETPGMELVIIRDHTILLDKSYGSANLEKHIPNNTDRTIWVASMSKQFTAFAIALLIDKGKISLEDDIRKFLPELKLTGKTIRIRHLLYHTSGLREGFTLTAMSFKGEEEYTNQNVLHFLSKQAGRNFEPGERFEYNNGGYVLLATIVERVSKMAFPDFIRENIFTPLGMDQSVFQGQFPVLDTNIAIGYAVNGDGPRSAYQPAYFKGNSYGSSGLITTARDLVKWDRVFYEPVFGKNIQKLQVQKGRLNNGQEIPYALGLEIENFKGKKVITHSGADAGYKAEIARFPDDHFTVICLANTEDAYSNTDRLFKVANLFLHFSAQSVPPARVDCAVSGIYLNRQTLSSMRFIKSSAENGTTISSTPDGPAQRLIQHEPCEFGIQNIETDKYILQGRNLFYSTRADHALLSPVKTTSPEPAAIRKLAGKYYSPELGVTYTFFEKDGTLFLKFFEVYDVPLHPYGPGFFVGDFLGTNLISFQTGKNGIVTGLLFNRDGIKGLAFKKN